MKTCSTENCKQRHYAKGKCQRHYRKERRRTNPDKSVHRMHKIRFGDLRNFVLKRDGYRCVDCGMSRDDHRSKFNRDLTLDHIDGRGRNSEFANNEPDNLETLCLRCHGHKDAYKHGGYSTYHV